MNLGSIKYVQSVNYEAYGRLSEPFIEPMDSHYEEVPSSMKPLDIPTNSQLLKDSVEYILKDIQRARVLC